MSKNSRSACAFKLFASKALNLVVIFLENQSDSSQQ